jgi:hypothetical protein
MPKTKFQEPKTKFQEPNSKNQNLPNLSIDEINQSIIIAGFRINI